jgi:peptidoglycan/xylan/chitin deacetylase (PgdA/CDA1 family)
MNNYPEIDFRKLKQGVYEVERIPGGIPYPRTKPDFTRNILHEYGLLYRPVVDEDHLERGGQKPVWPEGKNFAICLTHDVDSISLYSPVQALRHRCKHMKFEKPILRKTMHLAGVGLDLLRAVQNVGRKDLLYRYEGWLSVEEEYAARSTLFFWPGSENVTKPHITDCLYEMEDEIIFGDRRCSIAEMIREIDTRGWEIGLHASWHSYNDPDEMKRQKNALEKMLGHEILSVRQHYLHYDIRNTPHVQASAGFKYDSTLGFNDNIGFRFGTCYPWHIYDLKAQKDLPIMEIPLIVQDGALLNPKKGLRLDEENALEYVQNIAEVVKDVGGVLTLLWHTHGIMNRNWWNLYLKTLEYLRHQNVWFASIKEIGEWWQKQEKKRI